MTIRHESDRLVRLLQTTRECRTAGPQNNNMARRTTLTTASEDEDEETAENRVCSRTDLQSASSLVLAVSCTLFGAFASQFMALSSQAGVPGLQLIFLMKLTQLLCVLVILPFVRPKLTTEDAPQALTLSATTVTDNLGTVLMFLSFVYVVPGVAFGVIQGAIPVSTACVGFLFLGERLDAIDSGGILCSAAGVVLVAVGMSTAADSSSHPQLTLAIGILLPLAAAFTKGPNNVLMRSLLGVRGVSVVTVVLYVQLAGTPALLAPLRAQVGEGGDLDRTFKFNTKPTHFPACGFQEAAIGPGCCPAHSRELQHPAGKIKTI
ncbi:PREDICTED: uncharacterized protein LOC109463489 [Branchiostoma belcheri]|uniref:Uncharacterized protein LOC109463489 n=1 Tax=Branchiostoma belcheri TaxID=7741 RepID=A0A6P4YAP9_BRABE|nr:PREDICTED: uncharacterized protein LOC109463489 [Branchiostoma belcheri]